MNIIKPIKVGSAKRKASDKMTSAEMGKTWAVFMGNSMAIQVLSYFLQHVEDEEIKTLLENALGLSKNFKETAYQILTDEKIVIPMGFTDSDVNLGAPKIAEDEFYVHYLKYACKAGMSIYSTALTFMYREDIYKFLRDCLDQTADLQEQIKGILMRKGLIIKPPYIPVPQELGSPGDNFMNGFINKRPLHALEIAHLYDNIESNCTSNALITAFHQVAKDEKVKQLFQRGRDMTHKAIESYTHVLNENDLPAPVMLNHLITNTQFSPFSDKLMLFHKMDMFSMKIRAFGNSIAVNGRHDVAMHYGKSLMATMLFVQDAANIMIEKKWMEEPPLAMKR